MDASDSAAARVDERSAVVNAAVVASTSVNGDGGGSTGGAPGGEAWGRSGSKRHVRFGAPGGE